MEDCVDSKIDTYTVNLYKISQIHKPNSLYEFNVTGVIYLLFNMNSI